MNNNIKTRRLFFALWPTDEVRHAVRDRCSQLPAEIKGRAMRWQNLHLTLHFLGQVSEETKDCVHLAARSISADAFELELDSFGYFQRAKILWMGVESVPAALAQLHLELGSGIEECGFIVDSRPYKPHMTLLRKCYRPAPVEMDFLIPWRVEEFVLVESITDQRGVNYQVIEKYPLSCDKL